MAGFIKVVNNMNEYVLTIIASAITGISSFLFGVKKSKRELEDMALTNIQKSIDVYKVIIDDLRGQIDILLKKVNELEVKVVELKTENHELHKMLKEKNK